MIRFEHIGTHRLETDPFRWAVIRDLFHPADAHALATTYPCDHFRLVAASGGEKDYRYEARPLIAMGANCISYADNLSDAWRALATDLLSPEYRAAVGTLTQCDLTQTPIEVNVFHYGAGGSLGPHRDLPEKLVTQVLYFNTSWNTANGGCLNILGSADPGDVVAEIPPISGTSSVLVRSENSWHAVSRVADDSGSSRRSVTVTFYRPGSLSSMWPAGDTTPLHSYEEFSKTL
ncbi:MAG TPA: 2OG-Fe(II) oxygenase [Bryobacteraceae bacterium]|nr:2OG-Fe(II) oxygenase [Bryobacteraceae bacterium]